MKNYIHPIIFIAAFSGSLLGFKNTTNITFLSKTTSLSLTDSTYIKEIQKWHEQRLEELKAEDSYLNLAGLFWLEEGENAFGSDKKNKIVFPKGDAFLGKFSLNKGEVSVQIAPNAKVNVENKSVSTLKIFPSEKTIVLQNGSLRWFVIKREDKYGIRLRDLESPVIKEFKDVETYPIDSNWRIEYKLLAPASNKKIAITNVLGQTTLQPSLGTLVFSMEGKEYHLEAIDGGDALFIIFKDKTSGKDTYGAGRFLEVPKPNPNGTGKIYIDFNKAYNPPCAFTEFATCPLPPRENWLPIPIKAGEKKYE